MRDNAACLDYSALCSISMTFFLNNLIMLSISEALMSLWFVDVLKFSGAESECEGAKHLFIHQIFGVDKHEERGLAFVSLIA